MGPSRTLTLTLPTEMFTRAEQLANKENRTMSELVREALRQYERNSWWDEMDASGRRTAEAAGVKNDQDVVDEIHAMRHERHATK